MTRDDFTAKLRRILALMRKESFQIVRDPSSIALGVVMPVVLILLFGYGLSLDVKNVPYAVVIETPAPRAMDAAAFFRLSSYCDARFMTSMRDAEKLMLERKLVGIVRLRSNFS